ncbi:MAG: hypothetical protein FJX72_16700 [Armatimonadetes bacterium]|nr:hypothetical protein [Armatimonadota bacterium]
MTATWTIRRVNPAEATPEFLFDLLKRHRLLPDNLDVAVACCRNMAPAAIVLEVMNEEHEKVADAVLSDIMDGEAASLDLMVVSRHYARFNPDKTENETPFNELTRDALRPALLRLIEARHLRRVTAAVPRSRNRTVNALVACGFIKEGVMRRAVKLRGKDPEDLVVMGLLPDKE